MRRAYLVGVLIVAAFRATPSLAQDAVAPQFTTPRAPSPPIPLCILHLDNHVSIKIPLEGKKPFTVEGRVVDANNTEVRHFAASKVDQPAFDTSLPPFAPGTYHLIVIVTDADGEIKTLNHFPEIKVPRR